MRWLIPVLLLAGCTAASAFEGNYRGAFQGQTLTVRKAASNSYRLVFSVGMPGCTGDVVTVGVAEGTTLQTRQGTTEGAGPAETCQMRVTKNGAKLVVEEQNCSYFHGARCEFSGTYTARAGKR